MLIFLKRLALFILVLVAIDQLLGFGLRQIYFSQTKGQYAQINQAVNKVEADILVFGSSRAIRHYDPAILSAAFGKSCYNVGCDAQQIPYYTALQDVIFRRKKPSMVILDINTWEFIEGSSKYEKLSILLPHCRQHPELIPYQELSSPYERWKLFSQVYPYNSTLFISANNILLANKIAKDENGYNPLRKHMTPDEVEYTQKLLNQSQKDDAEKKPPTDTVAFRLLHQFLNNCTQNGIPTYVVISPKLAPEIPNVRKDQLIEIVKQYKNVKFLDFTKNDRYNNHFEKFADIFHLNKEGAEEFSHELVDSLRTR